MKKIFLITLLLMMTLVMAAQNISGVVTDADDGLPVPSATVQYKGHKIMTMTDLNGAFSLPRQEGLQITISSVGYKTQTIRLSKYDEELDIRLKTDTRALDNVVVKGKRKRYKRKENPAVALMKRVIAAGKLSDLSLHDYYSFEKYRKMTISVNDVDTTKERKGKRAKPWYREHMETSDYNGKVIFPLSVEETVTRELYQRNPKNTKQIILGEQSEGMNKLILTGEMLNTMLKEVFQDVNLYSDYIPLMQKPFPSPVGSAAISFYHFYIQDTVTVNADSCYHLRFFPANQQDFGFSGDLYVLKDSTLHVRKCLLNIPKKSDVNFVKSLRIDQEFSRLDDGEWVLSRDDMGAELSLIDFLPNMLVTRNTRLYNYNFDSIPPHDLKGKAPTVFDPNAHVRYEDDFWQPHRNMADITLTHGEATMGDFVENMKKVKGFNWVIKGAQLLVENFVETGKKGQRSKFDVGPVNTIVSKNFVDGLRFRASGRTMAALNPHLFWKGYGAYGVDSKRWYYGSEITYSLNKKEHSPYEFPMRNIVFESYRDVMSPSDKFISANKDNVFMSLRTQDVNQMYFFNRQRLSFLYETEWGLGLSAALTAEHDEPTGDLYFRSLASGADIPGIRTTDVTLGVHFFPNQTFVNTKQRRLPVNLNAPEFTLQHTIGMKGFLGGDYRMNRTELKFYKRQWLGSFGCVNIHLNAGAEWNKVPMPLLLMAPTNMSYFDNDETFSLMNNMEFLNDRYVFWSAAWDMNGKLLNRIPLIRHLKWREYLSIKGMWGRLTDKNNPTLHPEDGMLMQFPENTQIMSNQPYWEVYAGVHNILKFFGVGYVRRLTYTRNPGVDKWGIRFSASVSF